MTRFASSLLDRWAGIATVGFPAEPTAVPVGLLFPVPAVELRSAPPCVGRRSGGHRYTGPERRRAEAVAA